MKRLNIYIILLISTICLALTTNTLFAQDDSVENIGELKDGVRHVNAAEAAQILKLDPSIRVLDVRTGFEYRNSRLDGSVNVNYYSFSFRKNLDKLDKDAIWLVHCKVGVRSGKTIPIMKEAGFTNIIHLDGGIDAWKEAGLPFID